MVRRYRSSGKLSRKTCSGSYVRLSLVEPCEGRRREGVGEALGAAVGLEADIEAVEVVGQGVPFAVESWACVTPRATTLKAADRCAKAVASGGTPWVAPPSARIWKKCVAPERSSSAPASRTPV